MDGYKDFYEKCEVCGKDYPYLDVRTRKKVFNKETKKVEWQSVKEKQRACSAICQGELEEKERLLESNPIPPGQDVNYFSKEEKLKEKVMEKVRKLNKPEEKEAQDLRGIRQIINKENSNQWKLQYHS